jgi:LacI family transcriptional regulator
VRSPSRPPTIRDVAASAGVSFSTVSLVLNGKSPDRIPEATRLRVLSAAKRLGYQVNIAARALRSGQVHALAFAAGLTDNRLFLSDMLLGAAAEASARGQALILFSGVEPTAAAAASELLDTRRADGLILHNIAPFNKTQLKRLADRVVVVQDRVDPELGKVKAVLLDASAGRRALMAHIVSLGHTAIAYLSPTRHTGRRLSGYQLGLQSAGIRREQIAYAEESIDSAATAAQRLLTSRRVPTAIVCANDILAAGVYQAASGLSLQIPRDVTVAAFAGFLIAPALQPQLTAVATPAGEAGRSAVRLLLELLQGEGAESVVVPFPLAIRGSSASPRVR